MGTPKQRGTALENHDWKLRSMGRNAGSFSMNKLLEKGLFWIVALCVCLGGALAAFMDRLVVLLTNWIDWAIFAVKPSGTMPEVSHFSP